MKVALRHLSLQVTISVLFTSLAIALGAFLSIQNYYDSSNILRASADQVNGITTEKIRLDIKSTYTPLVGMLQMLALLPAAAEPDEEANLGYLEQFVTVLDNYPAATNVQVGYSDGSYFIVRHLGKSSSRAAFDAPADSYFMSDYIGKKSTPGGRMTRTFYGKDYRVIAKTPGLESDYDPRVRPWYQSATSKVTITSPYFFYFSKQTGITATLEAKQPGAVFAIDITLGELNETIQKYRITPSTQAALVSASGEVYALGTASQTNALGKDGEVELAGVDQLGIPVLSHLWEKVEKDEQTFQFEFERQDWEGISRLVGKPGGVNLYALVLTPTTELLSEAAALRDRSIFTTILITLLFIPVIWFVSTRISRPLRSLAAVTSDITRFKFDTRVDEHSFIKEVDTLSGAIQLMQSTVNRFLGLVGSISGERSIEKLLDRVTQETRTIGKADAAVTYLLGESEEFLVPGALCTSEKTMAVDSLEKISLDSGCELAKAATSLETVVFSIDDNSDSYLTALRDATGFKTLSAIALPLTNRNQELVGLLCLFYQESNRAIAETHSANLSFVRELSGFTALTLESRRLLKMQEDLLDSFIKLLADAIDAKSPYTGGHCKRVPEITLMLAQAACDSTDEAFVDFDMSPEQWQELEIASWLHDCGKVTTPEYVVDKATKLETIFDRIHEVRMRFEVLKRDAEIEYLKGVADGKDSALLQQVLQAELQTLDEEFAFVAECNLGGEYMAEDKVDRLKAIGSRTWLRTIDNRLGVSWEEAGRMQRTAARSLPVTEQLLADKEEHIIYRDASETIPDDNPWGFKLDVPEHKYNRGELYNLSIARGTLSEEDRYKINDHMTQTILMLENLPFPKHLRNVPAIAGGHHETMDGRGYPRRLRREDMSLTARMMAIADIFEALTASDRPYKKAKKLSEAIRIMSFMRNDEHIDPDLFELFLSSGVYREYADKYLDPDNIDDVDIKSYFRD